MTICTVKYFHSWNAETGGGSVYNRIMLIYTVNCQPAKTVSFFLLFLCLNIQSL